MGSLSGTGVAARAQGTKTTAPGLTLREARQQQKFRQINSNDNAATTTRLVNPPAAVIPNPAGVGGEAGAQGAFGSMSGGAAPQGAYGGSYNPTVPITGTAAPVVIGAGAGPRDRNGVVNTPPPSAFQQIWDVYSNPNTYIDPFMPSNNIGTNRRVASGDAQGLFPGVQAGGGAVNQGTAANQNAQGYFAQQPYTGTAGYSAAYNQQQNIGFNNPHPSRGGTQPTYGPAGYMSPNAAKLDQAKQETPYPWGTAGMYTYGSFSNKDEAFLTLMERGVPTNQIPADIADNLGLSQALSDPSSGWKLVGGRWVNQNPEPFNPNNPLGGGGQQTSQNNQVPVGSTDYTSTDFYKNYVANNTPFEEQLRWDGTKYVSVGAYMKRKNGDWSGNRESKIRQRKKLAARATQDDLASNWFGGTQTPSELQNPYQFTGSWGVVNFNTGTG